MRQVILVIVVSTIFLSCGQNNNKQKELELKERELALKQKELELEENNLQKKSGNNNLDNISIAKGLYRVITDKSYFFDAPNIQTKRKGYLLINDEIEIKNSQNEFAFGVFTTLTGRQITGWILLTDLEKTSNILNNKGEATLEEIYQANDKIFSENGEKIFNDPRILTRMKNLMGKKKFEEFQVMNLWGLKNEEVNNSYFFTYYNSCPRACGTYGVIYGDIINNNLIIGTINLDVKWYKENKNESLPQKLNGWVSSALNGTLD